MSDDPKYTSQQLVALLRNRFPRQSHAVFEQVADGTGYGRNGWVDAVVVGLWPSEGLTRMAIEIKVSRSDFLRELKAPGKNQWARDYCHEFWFIAPGDCIKEQELPDGVGWMKPRGDTLVIVRHASRKAAILDDSFTAALARASRKELEEAMKTAKDEAIQTDSGYIAATAYRTATERFLRERGRQAYHSDADKIIEELRAATADQAAAHDAEAIQHHLGRFQDRMLDLLEVFAELAVVGLNERDATGERLLSLYGRRDEQSIARITERLKARKKKGFVFQQNQDRTSMKLRGLLAALVGAAP